MRQWAIAAEDVPAARTRVSLRVRVDIVAARSEFAQLERETLLSLARGALRDLRSPVQEALAAASREPSSGGGGQPPAAASACSGAGRAETRETRPQGGDGDDAWRSWRGPGTS